MCERKVVPAQIRETVSRLREAAEKLQAEGNKDGAADFMEKAARLEDSTSREDEA